MAYRPYTRSWENTTQEGSRLGSWFRSKLRRLFQRQRRVSPNASQEKARDILIESYEKRIQEQEKAFNSACKELTLLRDMYEMSRDAHEAACDMCDKARGQEQICKALKVLEKARQKHESCQTSFDKAKRICDEARASLNRTNNEYNRLCAEHNIVRKDINTPFVNDIGLQVITKPRESNTRARLDFVRAELDKSLPQKESEKQKYWSDAGKSDQGTQTRLNEHRDNLEYRDYVEQPKQVWPELGSYDTF